MISCSSFLKSENLKQSLATALPNSTGENKQRLSLDSSNSAKIAAFTAPIFVILLSFFDKIISMLGIERKWVEVVVQDKDKNQSTIVLNINSLCKRTLLNRSEILDSNATKLSEILAAPTDIVSSSKSLNELYPNVLLINMKEREDRIKDLKEHLTSIGQTLKYTRIDAVIGKNLDPDLCAKMSDSDSAIKEGRTDRIGRMGCLQSHLKTLKHAKEQNFPFVLVCEDDVRFMPEYFASNYAQKAMKELPEDWGICFLGYYEANAKETTPYSEHLIKPSIPYDNHAMLVNGSMLDTIINAFETELEKDDNMRAADVIIAEELTHLGRTYACKDNIAIQTDGVSSIVNKVCQGNYQKELTKLRQRIPTPLITTETTADGFPVMKPLLAGTLYQYAYHIAQIFDKHKIAYWMDSGTLLGAERNKGLIPWDDDIDLCILPGEESKLINNETLNNELKAVGLELTNHWLGAKIQAIKEHPLGKTHAKDGCTFKTPNVDIFFTQEEVVDEKAAYFYKDSGNGTATNARKIWDKTHTFHNELYDENNAIRKMPFGPTMLNGLWGARDYCIRSYEKACFSEAYLMYDHLNEVGLERRPISMTDFRAPSYTYWDGVFTIPS